MTQMFEFATESGLYRVKSPLNYVGGKFDLLGQLLNAHDAAGVRRGALIPEDVRTFVDVFCGGFNVGSNVKAESIIGIDLDKDVIALLSWMRDAQGNAGADLIAKITYENGLGRPRTKKITAAAAPKITNHGYEGNLFDDPTGMPEIETQPEEPISTQTTSTNASTDESGKKSPEENAYYNLRQRYNAARMAGETTLDGHDIRAVLYTLICHGFNSHIRFGPNGYNIPFGHRTFNHAMRRNFNEFAERLALEAPTFVNAGFDHAERLNLDGRDYVYLDPPYLITTAPYNESGQGWSDEDDRALYAMLDRLDAKGVRFGLSNVVEHAGRTNNILAAWSEKYVMHELDYHYDQASYNLKMTKDERAAKPTREVFVTNVRA